MTRHWILQCNPDVWDVFSWWEDGEGDLDDWTVSQHLTDLHRGDRFAFWVGGREAGVYAVGRLAGGAYPIKRPSGGYWKKPPSSPTHAVDLSTEQYLFGSPLLKTSLIQDRGFSDALVIRMPRTANPIKMTEAEWDALSRHLPSQGRRRTRPNRKGGDVVVTERALGSVKERTTVTSSAVERVREHREAALVKRYQAHLRRPLRVKSIALPSGERLVTDGFDEAQNRLIEAKASVSRQDIRMAIGQLLDYRRHLKPRPSLTLLMPERPSEDLVVLLRGLKIEIVVESRKGRFGAV